MTQQPRSHFAMRAFEHRGRLIILPDAEFTPRRAWFILKNDLFDPLASFLVDVWEAVTTLGCGYDAPLMERVRAAHARLAHWR